MGASSVPRLRLQEGQTAKPPGAVRKRTSQRPCGHPLLPVRARRRREEEGRQKKESRKRRQRFSDPPGEAPGRPPPTRGVPIAGTCYRKARSFVGFRFVSRSRSPPRPRGRRLTLVGVMALVVAFILEQFSQARVVLAIVLSSSRRGGAWLVASPSPIWAPESLSRRSPQEDHTERKSLFRQRRLPRMLKKALSALSACMGRVVWGAKDFLQPTRSQPLVTHSPGTAEWARPSPCLPKYELKYEI